MKEQIPIKKRKSPPPFSTEHREKIGAYWKGKKRIPHVSSMKGKSHTPDANEKNRLAHLGTRRSEETKKKIGIANRGEKNNFWEGGKMKNYSEMEQIRKSIEYKLWRDACFARDNYTCQKTGIKGLKLVVHHINNFADFPELRLAINNGVTLSEKSHKLFHKIFGNKKNTREQLIEFLNNKNI